VILVFWALSAKLADCGKMLHEISRDFAEPKQNRNEARIDCLSSLPPTRARSRFRCPNLARPFRFSGPGILSPLRRHDESPPGVFAFAPTDSHRMCGNSPPMDPCRTTTPHRGIRVANSTNNVVSADHRHGFVHNTGKADCVRSVGVSAQCHPEGGLPTKGSGRKHRIRVMPLWRFKPDSSVARPSDHCCAAVPDRCPLHQNDLFHQTCERKNHARFSMIFSRIGRFRHSSSVTCRHACLSRSKI
jgi:hypothetical protein